MLGEGDVDRFVDAHPIADSCNFTEGHAGLGHAPWPGIHAEEDDLFFGGPVFLEVGGVRFPCVSEGVVDVGSGRLESELVNGVPQSFSGFYEGFGEGHGVKKARERLWLGREWAARLFVGKGREILKLKVTKARMDG